MDRRGMKTRNESHLLLEIPDSVVVRVCKEMCDGRMCLPHMVFHLIHQEGSVALPEPDLAERYRKEL